MAAGYVEGVAQKWWQRKWYFVVPVVVVLGAGVYLAVAGDWRIAALYFGLAAFYAVLQRRKWQRYGKPSEHE